jgi:hypothetical protein
MPRSTVPLLSILTQTFHPFERRYDRTRVYAEEGMAGTPPRSIREHKHTAVTRHGLSQRAGIPYEVERIVCAACRRVLGERELRRAAA